jgi:predicted metal-dependent hydrolase
MFQKVPGRFEQGINFFNAERYFEAHEAWEDMWREEQGELRLFYQGLVQAAVGLHHLTRGNLRGGRSQIVKSLSKLEQYPNPTAGIEVERLCQNLRDLLADPEAILSNKPRICNLK